MTERHQKELHLAQTELETNLREMVEIQVSRLQEQCHVFLYLHIHVHVHYAYTYTCTCKCVHVYLGLLISISSIF